MKLGVYGCKLWGGWKMVRLDGKVGGKMGGVGVKRVKCVKGC